MKQEKTEKLSKIFKGNELHFLSFIYSLEMNTESKKLLQIQLRENYQFA